MTANLSRILDWNRYRNPDKAALVEDERTVSYRELDEDVNALAHALLEAGCGCGDVVGLLGGNSIEYVESILAICKIGAITLPLNVRLHPEELAHTMDHAGCATLIADADLAAQGEATVARMAGGGRLFTFGAQDRGPWTSLVAERDRHRGRRVPDADLGLDAPQRILYTSGTTGRPKGVVITHGNSLFNHLGQMLELGLGHDDRVLMSAPLYHVSGLDGPGFTTLYVGATWVVTRQFGAEHVLRLIATERITGLVLAAPILVAMMNLPELDRYPRESVRWLIFGSLPPPLFLQVQDLFPEAHMADVFGMTELTNGSAYLDRRHSRIKPASQGRAFPHMDVAIVDDQGAPLPPGEAGELVWRGPKVSAGYWRDAAATEASRRNGWLLTGDVARVDAEGYLWFMDRKKDMIKSGGENVASAEIERVLLDHPSVIEAAVIGVPDARWGEVPKAFVVLKGPATPDQLIAHCADHLAKFKVPKRLEIVGSLPRNVSGKVLKRQLREAEAATPNQSNKELQP